MALPDTLDLAFIGCGFATRLHSRTLRKFPGIRRHYASRSLERARETARRHDGAGHFGSYERALASDEIDAVLIATPPSSHLELTLAALDSGKHVIVEKPPFLSCGDLDIAARTAERTGRRVLVAENYFYKPLAFALRRLLQERVVGDPVFVHLCAVKTQEVEEEDWRSDPETAGGGALFEGGIHWIDLAANLGLELTAVRGLRAGPGDGPERSMLVTLEYAEGAVGSLLHSWEIPSLFQGLRWSKIYGTEGSITFESNGLVVLVRGRRTRVLFPGLRDIAGYRAMFEDLVGCLREARDPLYTLEHARHDLRLVEEAHASAERRRVAITNERDRA